MLFCINAVVLYAYLQLFLFVFCILFFSFLNSIRRRIRLFGEALFVQFKNLNLSRQEKLEPASSSTKTVSGHERTDIVINRNLYRRKLENQNRKRSTTKYSGMSGRIQWNKKSLPMKIGEPN